VGERDGFQPRMDAEVPKESSDVVSDCVHGQVQFVCNLLR
jgi:hypothetical protein